MKNTSILGLATIALLVGGCSTGDDSTATAVVASPTVTINTINTIAWDTSAALIWTSDLQVDNTILWRVTVAG
ncbi:MAG: hypothetical protein LH616_05970 [Ilumatobacteraceae bacterium]|nr:hypothetical protein [Ilumatobacteraceae bacterium]